MVFVSDILDFFILFICDFINDFDSYCLLFKDSTVYKKSTIIVNFDFIRDGFPVFH